MSSRYDYDSSDIDSIISEVESMLGSSSSDEIEDFVEDMIVSSSVERAVANSVILRDEVDLLTADLTSVGKTFCL